MKIKRESSRLVSPLYSYIGTKNKVTTNPNPNPNTTNFVSLSTFDTITFNTHMALIYAYRPPTPPNSVIELGLRIALSHYRELAGRFLYDDETSVPHSILLNDEGVRFVEAYCDQPLDSETTMDRPRPEHLNLHPSLEGVISELAQVQLTRFSCGTLVVGFTSHHVVADGFAMSNFMAAWGQAARNLPIDLSLPMYSDRSVLFVPRNQPQVKFNHREIEYMEPGEPERLQQQHERSHCHPAIPPTDHKDDLDLPIVVHKAHFSGEFITKLKRNSMDNMMISNTMKKPFTTFECLLAHLWRNITRARGLDGKIVTQIKIGVNGRARMKNIPADYFGNLVLWAYPKCTAGQLLKGSLADAAMLIREAVALVDDGYFRSFVDFSSGDGWEERTKGLVTSADVETNVLCPDLEVHSWLRFPFSDLDFGSGGPSVFMPSYFPDEGALLMVPSLAGKGGDIDAYIPLFNKDVDAFKQGCYSLSE